jgi:hypothetical protein
MGVGATAQRASILYGCGPERSEGSPPPVDLRYQHLVDAGACPERSVGSGASSPGSPATANLASPPRCLLSHLHRHRRAICRYRCSGACLAAQRDDRIPGLALVVAALSLRRQRSESCRPTHAPLSGVDPAVRPPWQITADVSGFRIPLIGPKSEHVFVFHGIIVGIERVAGGAKTGSTPPALARQRACHDPAPGPRDRPR